jgi:hypothetical protein
MRTPVLHRLRPGLALLSGLWALAAVALSPPMPPMQGEYTSPGGRFRVELLSNLANKRETQQKPGAEGGTVEVSYEFGSAQQLITTRQKDAQGQLTAVRMDLRLFDAQGASLSLFDKQEEPTAPPRWTTVVSYVPRELLISESGQYVVTLDHWDNRGRSRDVVVLFGPEGKLRWRLTLKDFLTEEELSRLSATETDIDWDASSRNAPHEIREADGVLVLQVIKRHWLPMLFQSEVVQKRISLETGKVVP